MNVAEKVSVTRPLVQVVDDDEALRNAAAWMLQGAGYEVRTYAAAAELLDALDTSRPCCVVSKEVDATETMIERVEERFALKPEHLAGDVAYGAGEMLGWLVGRDIDPHIPVWDRSAVAPEGKFTRADFAYDKERDLYICPGGKKFKTSGTVHGGAKLPGFRLLSVCNLQGLGKSALRLRVMLGRQGQKQVPFDAG